MKSAMAELSEHQIQSAFFDWARLHPVACRAYAVPNGGLRNIKVASKLQREGVRKGVLDIHLPVPRGKFHGLFIEFKAGSNKLTPEQLQECEVLVHHGFAVIVAWDHMLAIGATEKYIQDGTADSFCFLKKPSSADIKQSSRLRQRCGANLQDAAWA